MNKIIMTRGVPASGKSTWAKGLVELEPTKWKIVNKDLLREMLDAGKWSKKNEKFILKVRDQLIGQALSEGFNVIVDDTNIHPSHEKTIREKFGSRADIEVKMFNIDLSEAIDRDLRRTKSVGERVIKRMFKELKPENPSQNCLLIYDPNLPDLIICDLDGTIALFDNKRSPYDAASCEEDELNKPVYEVLVAMKDRAKLMFLSGREDKFRDQTVRWLDNRVDLRYDGLHMRAEGDFRKDSIIKEELYRSHVLNKYNVLFLLDDRNQVVELWRSLGLVCFQVAAGDF